MRHTPRFNRGYTLIEIVVAIMVFSIIVLVFGIALTSSYDAAFVSKARSQTAVTLQNAMDIIEKDVRYSVEFNGTTEAPYTDLYGRSTTQSANSYIWNYNGLGDDSRVLILSNYASSMRSSSDARRPIYIKRVDANLIYSCTNMPEYLPKLQYRTIYFLQDKKLYRRILTDTTTAICDGQTQAQKQSCPATAFSGTTPAICKARDEIVAQNVSAFSVTYYKDADTLVDNQYRPNGESFLIEADLVTVKLTLKMPPRNEAQTTTLQITRIN